MEMSSDDDTDDDKKHVLKSNPSKFQKVTKYALFYSFVIVIIKSG